MSRLFKRTKILATVGPSVFAEEKIKEMVYAGVNGFRINFSHGSYKERDGQIDMIRKYATERGKSVAIVQDLQGPKIRLGMIKDNHMDLKKGDELILDSSVEEHDGGTILPVQYNLASRMEVGQPIFIFDGRIRGKVLEKISDTAIRIKVLNDGYIMSRKGINIPDTDMGGDIITEKDMSDIEYGASRDFDYVAMSFIQSADDVEKLRQILASYGSRAQIIAKIETKKAIEDDATMEAIVKATDGIMIARGDMAIEAGAEVVPVVQRRLIELCRENSKLCIVATQMLASMVDNPEPTRAEVSDVATAVLLGADAVMLSDETANGDYPIETIKAMKNVILYTQEHSLMKPLDEKPHGEFEHYDAVTYGAVKIAEEIDADLIVASTKSGATAVAIAAQRPNLPILSITDDRRVANQLALSYGNASFVRPYQENMPEETVRLLKEDGYLQVPEGKKDLTVIFLAGSQRDKTGTTDTIMIRKV
jgi:pyruvate kinase